MRGHVVAEGLLWVLTVHEQSSNLFLFINHSLIVHFLGLINFQYCKTLKRSDQKCLELLAGLWF